MKSITTHASEPEVLDPAELEQVKGGTQDPALIRAFAEATKGLFLWAQGFVPRPILHDVTPTGALQVQEEPVSLYGSDTANDLPDVSPEQFTYRL